MVHLLRSVKDTPILPINIRQDNQGAIALGPNPVNLARGKHMEVRHHFILEKIQDGIANVEYCKSSEMIADCLAIILPKEQYNMITHRIGLAQNQGGSVD